MDVMKLLLLVFSVIFFFRMRFLEPTSFIDIAESGMALTARKNPFGFARIREEFARVKGSPQFER